MALKLANTEYEHREVSLRNKPEAMLKTSPKGSVPVFITSTGKIIDESLDIIRWAMPDADLDHELISAIDGPFKHHLDRYKYASRYDETLKRGDVDLVRRAEAVQILTKLERVLDRHPFLSGPSLGPTDFAIFPFVRQFAAVEKDWWESESGLKRTCNWLRTCVDSDLFTSVMAKHPLWTEHD